MNEMMLLEAIGDINDSFILSAQQTLIPAVVEESKPRVRRMPKRKALLLAAAVALFLLLVGCAVVLFGLQDMNLGRFSSDGGFGRTYTADYLSLQGLKGTPAYEAALEYQLFLDSYDKDREILDNLGTLYEDPHYPGYEAYLCYTPEMKAKIDEICEKYDLNLLGELLQTNYAYKMYQALGMEDVVQGAVYNVGYVFPSGTFQMSGRFALPWDNAAHWNYDVEFVYRNSMKTDFDTATFAMRNLEEVTQWHYTTASGEDVLLMMSKEKAGIVADREAYFVTVLFNPYAVTGDGETVYMDKAAVEAVADQFTFTYDIHPLDTTILTPRDLYGYVEEPKETVPGDPDSLYGTYLYYFMTNSEHPELMYFARVDVDGDGVDEVLLSMQGGTVQDIITIADGALAFPFTGGDLYVCRGGVVEQITNVGNTARHTYYHLKDGRSELIGCVMYAPGTDMPYSWSETGGAAAWNWTEISETEFNNIFKQYPRVPVELQPLPEYWNLYETR